MSNQGNVYEIDVPLEEKKKKIILTLMFLLNW